MLTKEKELERQKIRDTVFEGRAYSEDNRALFRKMAEEFANDGYSVYLREDEPAGKRNYDNYTGDGMEYSPGPLHLEIYNRPGLTVTKAVVDYVDHPQ
jgi:hypothetical protein